MTKPSHDAPGPASARTPYTVTGTVISQTSAGVGGLVVQLVDKTVGPDLPLGSTTTGPLGRYQLSVQISARALEKRRKTRPDLQARVYSGQTFLAASVVRYNASTTETLDVVLPPGVSGLPSEYETLIGSVAQIYPGRLSDLQEGAERQDITFLANKSGWDARAVALAVLADQFSQIAAPRRARSGAAAPSAAGLQAEFYYALFRAGLPADVDALFQASPAAVQAVWQDATAQGVIPRTLADSIPAAVKTFQDLSANRLLTTVAPVGLSTLQAMLAASNLGDAKRQQRFADLYVQHRGDPAALWPAVTAALGDAVAKQLQLAGKLFYMTLNNAPLLVALTGAEKGNPLTSTVDLATRGYYDPAKWQPLIGTSIPPGIPGTSGAAQQANYAQLLAAQVRVAHPTAVLAAQVAAGVMKLSDGPAVGTAVHDFLMKHQGQFEIGLEPVEAFIARNKLTGAAPAVVAQIKRLQRVHQLTPDDQSMAALLANQLDSAYAVTRYDADGFKRTFATTLGGNDAADAIHSRARQVFSATLNVAVGYLGARIAPPLGGGFPIHIPFPPPPPPSYPVIAYPTLESLFGSTDYCDCEDCRSILSPAAYLVDLLHYLDQPAPTPGYQSPQTVLLQRRPDLQYLPLSCENTNTALPTIDLVNETLEYFVAHGLSLANYQGHDTGSVVTSAELLACPQYVDDAAYTLLQSAFFPPPLPYNRPLALLRQHMQGIGVALPDVMATLRASDAVERGAAAYGWRDILLEELAISRDEYRLFTDTTLELQGLYGYSGLSDADVLTTLQTMNLQAFSRRTGVSYDDLSSILRTTFINPGAALIPRIEALDTTFAALQALVTTPSTAAAFIGALPAGLDATQYGGANPTDYDAVVSWVTNPDNFAQIMGLVVITDPSGGPDTCSGTSLQLRHANPDDTANLLSATDLTKLMLFIRLWQKLGLSIEQTDDALAALYPAADLPSGTNDAVNLPLLATGFSVFLPRLGFLMMVMKSLGLSADAALAPLLACWAPIDATEPDSLYASMFLTPTLVQPDAAFAPNAYGVLFSNGSEPLMAHQATLCAAFNLTGAELGLTTAALGYTPTTPLNLANISAIYRVGWLAHTLGISVLEFLWLRQYSGLDPFAPLDPGTAPPAEPSAVRFIRLQQALNAAGLPVVQALYLMWNQDISGKLSPPLSAMTGLARTLRADYAAVDAQFLLVDDPNGTIAQGLMTLVYGASATDLFFGLLNNTLVTSVTYGNPTPTLAQPILDAASGRLTYDDLRKQLAFGGALDAPTRSAIDLAITNNGNFAPLHAALAGLATANQQVVGPFFATYPELLPLYSSYVASSDPPQTKRNALLASFLPTLTQKRKQEQALSAATAAAGGDPSFAPALLQDPTILHASADPTRPAGDDLTAIEAQGLEAQFFLTNNPAANPDQSVDAFPTLACAPGSNPLPPGQGGSAIAVVWSGFLDAPQDGSYNFSVAADAGATVSLVIAGTPVTGVVTGDVWSNTSPVSLTAGQLASIVLTVTTTRNTLSLTWSSLGLGSQVIPPQALYSASLVARLGATYTRFVKAVTLASPLSLDANEIAWLGTDTAHAVNTLAKDHLAPGNVTFTPASMANVAVGSLLAIDRGPAQETVAVTAVTATQFTATTTQVHDGTISPFPIVSQARPQVNQGWLNYLSAGQPPAPADAAQLGLVLMALLDFARIKAALSSSDERLLALLQNPAATLPNGGSALLALTGWAQDSVDALLEQFFGDSQPSHLATVENFRRVYDAYAIVTTCRITATALLAATTNAPSPAAVAALQSALRALYAEPDWLTVVKPINDAMRIQQRDALVAYVLQQMGDAFAKLQVVQATSTDTPTGAAQVTLAAVAGVTAGMVVQGLNVAPGTTVVSLAGNDVALSLGVVATLPSGSSLTFVPAGAFAIDTADKLYEYLLIDVETQPPVQTSRILAALSATQLFTERVLRNLEPQVAPTDIDGSLWVWMKRYRVWQANRETFLWPENWLYPELRDNQSPFFQQAMSALLQGDITDDAAASAYLDYLTSLEAVAKLEICGLYYVAPTSDADETSYVVARTAGANRKYYFRMLQYGSWTPWTEVPIECEDMPLTPIVWNGRLFLFWLKVVKQTVPLPPTVGSTSSGSSDVSSWQLSDLQNYTSASESSQSQAAIDVSAVLHWTEFYNGKWQPTKTSEVSRPTYLGRFASDGPNSFDVDRNLQQLIPLVIQNDPTVAIPFNVPADALVLALSSPVQFLDGPAGFILYNTHSLPVRFDDIDLGDVPLMVEVVPPASDRWFWPNNPYTGGNAPGILNIQYILASDSNGPVYTNNIIGFNRVPRFVAPQPGLANAWDAPFFYEDRRYVFYVTTSEDYYLLGDFGGFGLLDTSPRLVGTVHRVPPLVLALPPIPRIAPVAIGPTVGAVASGGSAAPVEGLLAQGGTLRAALGSSLAVRFQGRQVYPTGSLGVPAASSGGAPNTSIPSRSK